MQKIPLNLIDEWERNKDLRIGTPESDQMLEQNLKLGQHSTLLVKKTPDGRYIALGGNNRLRKMRELTYTEAKVVLLETGQDEQGYYPLFDAEVYKNPDGTIPYHFQTIDELEYVVALSHNTNPVKDNSDGMANLVGNFPNLPYGMFTFQIDDPLKGSDFINMFKLPDEISEDQAPAVDETQTISEVGKVYQLGRHRLMCGDATKIEDVEKLMNGQKADMVFTDPPYNVKVDYNSYEDNKSDSDFNQFTTDWLNIALSIAPLSMIFSGIGFNLATLKTFFDIKKPDWICIWIRTNSMSHSPLRGFNNWEPILLYGKPANPFGQDIFDFPVGVQQDIETTEGQSHPTPKPMKLCVELLSKASNEQSNVLDLFGGSGSTLIACEQTNRTCYMMELDPKYCDVIRKRYAKFIGKEDEWIILTPEIPPETAAAVSLEQLNSQA